MTPPTITAWAIKAPDGRYIAVRFSKLHLDQLMEYLRASRGVVAEGYRCVRVNITEVQE